MSALLNLFPNDVRSNGESFYYGSETLITTVKEGKKPVIEAHVGEEKVYGVRLEGTPSGVVLTCSCGEVTPTRACAHMWATLLESMSDSTGEKWLRKRFNRDVIQALEDVVDPEFDDDDYVGEEIGPPASWDKSASQPRSYSAEFSDTPASLHETHSWRSSGGPASRSLSNLHAPPTPPATPLAPSQSRSSALAWQNALRSVEMYGAMDSRYRRASKQESTQPLSVYFLVRPSWLAEMPVELEILGQRKNTRGWGKLKPVSIQHSDLSLIDSEEDAAILRRLTGSRDSRIPDELGSQVGFLLRSDAFAEIAPEIASRGRLLGIPSERRTVRSYSRSRYQPTAFDVPSAVPLTWDPGDAWRVEIGLDRFESGSLFMTSVGLVRGDSRLSASQVEMFPSGFAIHGSELIRIGGEDLRPWIQAFENPREIPEQDLDAFLEASALLRGCPSIRVPEERCWSQLVEPPVPRLVVAGPGEVPDSFEDGDPRLGSRSMKRSISVGPRELAARIEFDYGGIVIDGRLIGTRVLDRERRTVVVRHAVAETEAVRVIGELGLKRRKSLGNDVFVLHEARLPGLVQELVQRGWQVWAKDAIIRNYSAVRTRVSSGIDWFAVHVQVSYDGVDEVDLSRVLDAIKRGERTVRLGDGTVGFLPEQWLRKNGLLLDVGRMQEGELRFGRHQAALLDALLASQPEIAVDETFDRVRRELRSFVGVGRVAPPKSFRAELRNYQTDSLAWFAFLRRFGFGGCLADDMGLGKTIMVLALLDSRRGASNQYEPGRDSARGYEGGGGLASPISSGSESGGRTVSRADSGRRPSLVVVPRSLVFNWRLEAERFAPMLRMHDHSGADRGELAPVIARSKADVVLTTYGVLRRDILEFKDVPFDYVVLDESQAIKNHWTSTSKSVRLLQARHRLAMSGTPVENHVGDLWSLFDFLNPGLLGTARRFQKWAVAPPSDETESGAPTQKAAPSSSVETVRRLASDKAIPYSSIDDDVVTRGTASQRDHRGTVASDLLAATVRPFVLRRTKAQVAPQLPEKIEQTVYCELGSNQRRLYESLRKHYQSLLLSDAPNSKSTRGSDRSRSAGVPDRSNSGEIPGNKAVLILEGLLRLRQAACHAGLVDEKHKEDASAKLDVLVQRLSELKEEGHKALVFSQFVGLLSFVRTRLDEEDIRYEYLDGKTKNRAERVARFQTSSDLDVFLISLKAGGVGLNLTAATYVFLLDPWWNPAVESQAIDRTHRIGQTRSVLACRMVARDTVEERILELQARKRNLADSIIQADHGLLQNLRRADLELLFS